MCSQFSTECIWQIDHFTYTLEKGMCYERSTMNYYSNKLLVFIKIFTISKRLLFYNSKQNIYSVDRSLQHLGISKYTAKVGVSTKDKICCANHINYGFCESKEHTIIICLKISSEIFVVWNLIMNHLTNYTLRTYLYLMTTSILCFLRNSNFQINRKCHSIRFKTNIKNHTNIAYPTWIQKIILLNTSVSFCRSNIFKLHLYIPHELLHTSNQIAITIIHCKNEMKKILWIAEILTGVAGLYLQTKYINVCISLAHFHSIKRI